MLATEVVEGVHHGNRSTRRRRRIPSSLSLSTLTVLPRRQNFLVVVGCTITMMAMMRWLLGSPFSSSSSALSKSSFRFVSSWSTSMWTSNTRIRRHYHDDATSLLLRPRAAAATAFNDDPHSTSNDQDSSIKSYRQSYQRKHEEMKSASRLQLAPMMEYTDRHFRQLVRLVSSRTLLWTEMIAANTLAYERHHQLQELADQKVKGQCLLANSGIGSADDYSDEYLRRYLAQAGTMTANQASKRHDHHHHHTEGPCVLQLGGSDPDIMYEAVETVMDMTSRGWCNYTALNLNVGCPSPKVAGKGNFGAALMDDPVLVHQLCHSMYDASYGSMPITVKCRIGTDTHHPFIRSPNTDSSRQEQREYEQEEYHRLCHFIDTVSSDGIVTDFSVHARIAVLQKSFSPADNRKVPPLKYHLVEKLVEDFPHLHFTLNGGIDTLEQAQSQLQACPDLAGIMIGRAWAADPWSFAMADSLLYNDHGNGFEMPTVAPAMTMNRLEILQAYGQHADAEELAGDPTKIRRFLTKAVTTLFTGEPNAKRYRIALDDIAGLPKKLQSQGQSLEGQPLLSDLILNAAHTHLSEDVLMRTPQDSYERRLYEEEKRTGKQKILIAGGGCSNNRSATTSTTTRSAAISEWQADRQKSERQSIANDERREGTVVEMNITTRV